MTQLREKAHLMTGSEIDRTLVHLAHEIIGKTENLAELILIGVRRRGVYLAQRLARKIADITGVQVATGSLDIQPYRDDVDGRGRENRARAQIDFPITNKD